MMMIKDDDNDYDNDDYFLLYLVDVLTYGQ